MPFDSVREPLSRPRQICLDAAALLRKHGMARFTREDNNGALCVHGAISKAAVGSVGPVCEVYGDNFGDGAAATVLVAKYLKHSGVDIDSCGITFDSSYSSGASLAYWNNEVAKDANEVIDALEGAAAMEETVNAT